MNEKLPPKKSIPPQPALTLGALNENLSLIHILALNLAILAGQWWILCYLDDRHASVLEFFFFLFFLGTVALSLKLWFYAFLTIFVSRTVDKD